ncbi:MAG: T9SS type A sorting domain-containing protein, partial [Saprospiraceae bacterium]|nr:T9SS type A sorting domain-containing protein [Saprospiraceae bacterium]
TEQDTTGPRTLYLSFIDSLTGCAANVSSTYFVNPLPTVSLTGVDSAYCSNGAPVNIAGFPQGANGNFLIPGTIATAPPGIAPSGVGTATFNPSIAANFGSNLSLYYTFTDGNGCKNIDTADILIFQPTVAPNISGLVPEYCATPDTITVNAAPATGQFVSTLIVPGNNFFIPASGGVGSHRIVYQASDTFTYNSGTLICTNYDTFDLSIRPLPQLAMDVAPNSEFCTSDADTLLGGVLLGGGNSLDTSYFSGTAGEYAVIDTIYDFNTNTITYETIHYFSPDTAGGGTHQLTYTGINEFGCVDSTTISVVVYEPPSLSPTVLKPLYCYKDPAAILVAGTGSYTLNGNPLTGPYDPDVGLPLPPRTDTLVYFNQNGSCTSSDTQYIDVAPNPNPMFSVPGFPDQEFCIGQDTVELVAVTSGGAYTGDGTRTGDSIFIADLAGTGDSDITYTITDSATGCSDTHVETFYVYNTPNVEFTSIGGCTSDPIIFAPKNNILGLITTDHDIDSIEIIRWNFEGISDSIVAMASGAEVNILDTITYQYPGPGIYNATLYVENKGNCADSNEVRIVVAPTISVLTTAPYDESFENSEGLWYAEGSGQTDNSIWAWGETTFKDTIDASTSPSAPGGSKVWLTQPDSAYYPIMHNSWVYSPCFDIENLDRPMISLDYWAHSVAGSDGAVIEYYDPNGSPHTWKPLGEINRGIEWYDTDLLLGEPGSQSIYVDNNSELVTPIGWSGNSQGWKNARYILDEQKNANRLLQLRVAFGSSQINANKDGGDGFAFDNVWIGPRQRTVLLEHFAHEDYPNVSLNETGPSMNAINDIVYATTLGSAFYQDIVHIQYQTNFYGFDNLDQYSNANITDEHSRSRKLYYQIQEAGNPVIDGFTDPNRHIRDFDPVWFEQNMLQPEIFDLRIDQFDITISGNSLVIDAGATFEPLQNLDLGEYAIYYAVVEDKVNYTQLPLLNHEMHGMLRALLPDASGKRYNQAWAIGDAPTSSTITGSIDLAEFNNLDINNLQLVVFIQRVDTKEVFQVATNRVITTFFTPTNVAVEEEVKAEAKVIGDANLYPNPAQDYIFVEFDQPLADAYDWKLMDVRGVSVREGKTLPGLQQLSIQNIDLPTGTYLFTMQTDQFVVTRKVIIRND